MLDAEELQAKIDKLARDVLRVSRNTLLVNLRFLDSALSQFELIPNSEFTLMTDGKHLVYSPKHVLMSYKDEKNVPARDYLHVVMHCIFRHMYGIEKMNPLIWDLACDIAVEAAISDLGLKSVEVSRTTKQQRTIDDIKKSVGFLTAEKIYRFFLDMNLKDDELMNIHSHFFADDHAIWHVPVVIGLGNDTGTTSEDSKRENVDDTNGQGVTATGQAQEMIWKEISERMQVDLETFNKQQGDRSGNMIQNLRSVNREKYDYTEFLRKFAVRGEVMKINDDEFDYIFYTYGLKLYDKMPLIEPLEYKEVKRIKEFVIAIDTSGSVAGEKVQSFIRKIYNILKSTESFFSKINLHIIQCDADIQEHVKITNQDEFDEWIENMVIKGLGGTDFRPVFSEVDALIKAREFTNLSGLIYFTDGYGTFPEKMPDYETAFVFVNDAYESPEVPPWAIKLVLQRDEI